MATNIPPNIAILATVDGVGHRWIPLRVAVST